MHARSGELAIPRDCGKLRDDFARMRRHPSAGVEMLHDIQFRFARGVRRNPISDASVGARLRTMAVTDRDETPRKATASSSA